MPFWTINSPDLKVSVPRRRVTRRNTFVSAAVDGRQVWFASSDAALCPAPEAFGSLAIIPAVYAQRRLLVEGPVCSQWWRNIEELAPLVASWSGVSPVLPHITERPSPSPGKTGVTALCFSGGVDSFFSLLREPRRADILVCALGYDVKLRDTRRCALVEQSVRQVAAELGRRAVVVASNLRQHRTVRAISWELTHGGALAALGHVLSDEVDRLLISSSRLIGHDEPFGSRWDVDPKFSSAALTIDHVGATFQRTEKLRSVAHEEIVRRHLRVCWENRDDERNCGRCEKCVRTMLILDTCGQLGAYETFRGGRGLLECLNQIPHVIYARQLVYESLLALGLSEPYRSAVERLVARSRVENGR